MIYDRQNHFLYYFQGSAFRCLKTGEPTDPVLEIAARESGVPISDILENLPAELSVWVDPGEVSYRIGEKGAVKVSTMMQKLKMSLKIFSSSHSAIFPYFKNRFFTRSKSMIHPKIIMRIAR